MFYVSQDSILNAILNDYFLILDTQFQRNRELQHFVDLVLSGTENLKSVFSTKQLNHIWSHITKSCLTSLWSGKGTWQKKSHVLKENNAHVWTPLEWGLHDYTLWL